MKIKNLTFIGAVFVVLGGQILHGNIFSVDPPSLVFRGFAGGANPPEQSVRISSSRGNSRWWATTSGFWMKLSAYQGRTPQQVRVSVLTAGLQAGQYSGQAVFVFQAGVTAAVQVTLELNPTPSPTIQLNPTTMSFSVTAGSAAMSQGLSITNSGGGTLSWTATSNAPWLSIQPVLGTAPSSPQVTANPNNLQPGSYNGQIVVSAAGATTTPPQIAVTLTVSSSVSFPAVPTGTHWADPSEFSKLKSIGYDFAIVTVDPTYSPSWAAALDAAQSAGLKLIVGAWPPPYVLNGDGTWSVSPNGISFLNYLASRASLVMAVFVYNEPYWTDPNPGGGTYTCGFYSAAQLRALRSKIQSVWPGAKIYHDIGGPAEWAPGGSLPPSYPCIGNKYADQAGVADYVGIWCYPFEGWGYRRAQCLDFVARQANYVISSMQPAKAVSLNQSFRCAACGEATAWPTPDQIKDWNCTTRQLPLGAISWYVWRQGIYDDYLVSHPQDWPLTAAAACK